MYIEGMNVCICGYVGFFLFLYGGGCLTMLSGHTWIKCSLMMASIIFVTIRHIRVLHLTELNQRGYRLYPGSGHPGTRGLAVMIERGQRGVDRCVACFKVCLHGQVLQLEDLTTIVQTL